MILDDITKAVAKRLISDKEMASPEAMKEKALRAPKPKDFPFFKALQKPGMSFNCEVKKASPSKGVIAKDFPYVNIAKTYEDVGASAISVLAERDYFQGSPAYVEEIAKAVAIPVLRKDFIIDTYQIYEARAIGVSAILLICAILDDTTLKKFFDLAKSLGLSVLVEAHDADEVRRALAIGAKIIGVNNRNLKDFTVSLDNSFNLRLLVPTDTVFVAESGIKTADDVGALYRYGVDAVLIGETFMRSDNKKAMLDELSSQCHG